MGPPVAAAVVALVVAGSALVIGSATLGAPTRVAPEPALAPHAQVAAHTQVAPPATRVPRIDPRQNGDRRGSPTPSGGYTWPTGGPVEIVRAFDPPEVRWAAGHRGVDLRATAGAPVVAAAHGVVAFAGRVAGRSVVSVDHPDGIRTTYEPVAPHVALGDVVRAGDVIGRLQDGTSSHCAPLACLHWGARRGAHEYLDPLDLVGEEVVIRLYPTR